MNRTIRYSVGDIELRATLAWALVAVAMTGVSLYVSIPSRIGSTSTIEQVGLALLALLGLAGSLFFHEFAHVVVAKRTSGEVVALSPQLAGALPDTLFEARDPGSEVWVGISGPIASWFLGGAFGAIWWATQGVVSGDLSTILGLIALANLGLAVVNMMPGYPFDGGRAARGVYWYLGGDLMNATKIVGYVGYVIIMAAMAGGAWLVVSGGTTAVWGVWVLITSLAVNRSVGDGIAHIFWMQNSHRLRVDDLFIGGTRRIQRDVVIDDAIERMLEGHDQGPMLVFDGDRAVGLVDLSLVRPVPRRLWTEQTIGDVMKSIQGFKSAESSSMLSELIELLPPDQEKVALITRNGNVIGATDREDVVRRLQQYLAAERLEKMRRGRR
ncbi:hypothetical protein BH23CHL2_BH23CHL2_32550 [soil metagenome]